jgi:hypothetical protein
MFFHVRIQIREKRLRRRADREQTEKGGGMERREIIQVLSRELESLTRLHIQYGLHNTEGFQRQKTSIARMIDENKIDTRRELDPLTLNQYRRYFG